MLGAVERPEQLLPHELLAHARPCIADHHGHLPGLPRTRDADPAVRGRRVQRILDEMPEPLFEAVRVVAR